MSFEAAEIPPISDGDLIDLNAGTSLPPPPQIPPSPEPTNLLDSELPDLEEKLKSSSTFTPPEPQKVVVDVEDILITLDDDELESNEALSVLMKLDDLLEATLLESNQILKGYGDAEVVELDECLLALDDYLNTCECDDDGSGKMEAEGVDVEESKEKYALASKPFCYKTKFLCSGFATHELLAINPPQAKQETQLNLFLSSRTTEAFTRNTPQRATFSTHNPEPPKNPVIYRSLRGTTAITISDDDDDIKAPSPPPPTPSWLRDSMRHLEHLALPSDVEVVNIETVDHQVAEEVVSAVPVVVVSNVVRPVSAPSVLMQSEHSGGELERSFSTSSRSRRPRSVSSVSSFESSVDTTPSGSPEPTPQRGGQQEQSNGNNVRR